LKYKGDVLCLNLLKLLQELTPVSNRRPKKIFDELGLSTTQAITLFFKQVTLCQGLPFAVAIPNAETRQAIDDAITGKNLHKAASVEDL
jgi:DNA-damage-inducible protein J